MTLPFHGSVEPYFALRAIFVLRSEATSAILIVVRPVGAGKKMSRSNLESTVCTIVRLANDLRLRHSPKFNAHVSYCAIFCQDDNQFDSMISAAKSIGILADNTPTGPVYVVPPIETVIGPLKIVKVRRPDTTRPEKGDADFAITNYAEFKATNIGRRGFKLIEREHFEMMELVDPDFDVRAYFSHPPVEDHPGIRESLLGSSPK